MDNLRRQLLFVSKQDVIDKYGGQLLTTTPPSVPIKGLFLKTFIDSYFGVGIFQIVISTNNNNGISLYNNGTFISWADGSSYIMQLNCDGSQFWLGSKSTMYSNTYNGRLMLPNLSCMRYEGSSGYVYNFYQNQELYFYIPFTEDQYHLVQDNVNVPLYIKSVQLNNYASAEIYYIPA